MMTISDREVIGMSLENEMRAEIVRLESELSQIDEELKKLQLKITNLMNIKKKKEHDLTVLKYNFLDSDDEKEIQTNLERLLKQL